MDVQLGETTLCASATYVPWNTIVLFKWFIPKEAETTLTEETLHYILYMRVSVEACDTLHNIRNRHPYVFEHIILNRR